MWFSLVLNVCGLFLVIVVIISGLFDFIVPL